MEPAAWGVYSRGIAFQHPHTNTSHSPLSSTNSTYLKKHASWKNLTIWLMTNPWQSLSSTSSLAADYQFKINMIVALLLRSVFLMLL